MDSNEYYLKIQVHSLPLPKLKETAKQLENTLIEASYAYYNTEQPIMDDSKFDDDIKMLKLIYEKRPDIKPRNSIVDRVGAPPKSNNQIRLDPPMQSLEYVTGLMELTKKCRAIKNRLPIDTTPIYTVEYKYDGIAVEVFYDKGELVYCSTRGDKEFGDDITKNMKTLVSEMYLPEHISYTGPLKIRGEAIIYLETFDRYNKRLTASGTREPYKNPRNCISGLLRKQLSDEEVSLFLFSKGKNDPSCSVTFFPYTLIEIDNYPSEDVMYCIETQYKFLSDLGFYFGPDRKIIFNMQEYDIQDAFLDISTDRLKNRLLFVIDGIVIKLQYKTDQNILGQTKHSPRWGFAYKFPPCRMITNILGVELSVNSEGTITPVALLNPVVLDSVTVSKCSLFNFAKIEESNICVGDLIMAERAGDTIPKITSVYLRPIDRTPIEPPKKCPVCGSDVVLIGKKHLLTKVVCSTYEDPNSKCKEIIRNHNKTNNKMPKMVVPYM